MSQFNKHWNRIRASDKSLFFFSAGSLLFLFLAMVMLLNLKSFITTDWKAISLFPDGNVHFSVTPYKIVTIIIATLVCAVAVMLYRRFQYNKVKQLFHRQKLAGMNQKRHRAAESSRIYQPAKKRKSPISLNYITVWNMDCCISVQKSHWGNIKTSSCTWKRNWKQACTVSWYQKS